MTLLVHWLWQGGLVALAAWLALRAMPRLDAATRHAILWVAVLTVLVLPLAWRDEVVQPPPTSPAVAVEAGAGVVLPEVPAWLVGAVCGAWLGWVVLGLAGLSAGWRELRRWREHAQPLPAHLRDDLAQWIPPLGDGQRADVRVSRAIGGACAIGFGRPTILLSPDLVDSLDRGALAQVVLHEQAHLERGDHWGRLAQSLVQVVAGLHPAVAWLLRQLDLEREAACDALVVSRTQAPRDYARSLVDAAAVEARTRTRRLPAIAAGATGGRGGLSVRVHRLLHAPAAEGLGARRPALAASVLVAGLSLTFAGTAAPAVVFADLLLEGPRAALGPLAARSFPARAVLVPPGPGAGVAAVTPRRPRRIAAGVPVGSGPDAGAGAAATAPAVLDLPGGPGAVVLEARPLAHQLALLPEVPVGGSPVARAAAGPWSHVATAGRAVGQAGGRTGATIGDAAARGGSAIGQGARRTGASLAAFFSSRF